MAVQKKKNHVATYSLRKMARVAKRMGIKAFTSSSITTISELSLSVRGALEIIGTITSNEFYKTMPSKADEGYYQDVYRVPYGDLELYVKFTDYASGPVVISFKLWT
ncbi:hypothetical protein D3C76_665660 [compost metagenome]